MHEVFFNFLQLLFCSKINFGKILAVTAAYNKEVQTGATALPLRQSGRKVVPDTFLISGKIKLTNVLPIRGNVLDDGQGLAL